MDTALVHLVDCAVETESGETVFATPPDRPLEVRAGAGRFLPEIERAAPQLPPGRWTELLLPPERACGPRVESLVRRLPLSEWPCAAPPEPGRAYAVQEPSGPARQFLVRALEDGAAVCDFNHPLAGRTLRVHLRLAGRVPA